MPVEASSYATEAINLSEHQPIMATCSRRNVSEYRSERDVTLPARWAVSQVIDRLAADSEPLEAEKQTADREI